MTSLKIKEHRIAHKICIDCGKNSVSTTVMCEECLVKHRLYRKKKQEENRKRFMLYRIKSRAKTSGIEFDISEDDFDIPEFCPVLGIPLNYNYGQSQDDSPSLDRINNSLGYVPGNVVVISLKANRAKNNLSLDELKRVVSWLEFIEGELK